MAHLQYALLRVCGWYPDQLHTSKIAITPGDFDATITTVGEVYYSLFAEKYASKYSDNIHKLHVDSYMYISQSQYFNLSAMPRPQMPISWMPSCTCNGWKYEEQEGCVHGPRSRIH